MGLRDWLFGRTEREKWASKLPVVRPEFHVGLPALDGDSARLYGYALPRNTLMPRGMPDKPGVNQWMRVTEGLARAYKPGQLVLGKLAHTPLGHMDDRPMVTIAGARAGKTSTVLEPNLYLYPGSMVVLDPKGELASKTAQVRALCGHDVHVLDPFGQSGLSSASFNVLSELDPDGKVIIDDVATTTQAIIVDEGDTRSKHWNDSARALLQGIILFTLTLPKAERHLVTVRQLLTLTHPALVEAVKKPEAKPKSLDEQFFVENRAAVEALLMAMANMEGAFDGILASIGKRFANTPHNERGSIFSTAAAQTDFLDSLPLREISTESDFALKALASDRPTTIYLCLPVGRMESQYRWLRMIVQQACTTLEKLGTYPREKPRILFLMEEFPVLGHMDIMERAAAYFPSFGVTLWAVIQDLTQLRRYYQNGWETFLGNAGVVQCFSNSDQTTLDYLARRMENLIRPFELRTAFSREGRGQLLMFEGEPPLAAVRLTHEEVAALRASLLEPPEASNGQTPLLG
jgi:type IV secretion system protein VirD4